jgi:iron complex transport system ATP-binding protein
MTCEDIVAAGRYPYTGMLGILSGTDRDKIDEALEIVKAFEIKDQSFNQISDGQKQRILLARALAQEPELLILDEPTSFLDVRYAVEILDVLRKLADTKGVCVIMSLHELTYAKRISDLVMCIKEHRVQYLDSPDIIFTQEIISELYDLPEDVYRQVFGGL